jgi:hypothetical protein
MQEDCMRTQGEDAVCKVKGEASGGTSPAALELSLQPPELWCSAVTVPVDEYATYLKVFEAFCVTVGFAASVLR